MSKDHAKELRVNERGPTPEDHTREAKDLLKRAQEKVIDAAWLAGKAGDHELDKSLTATAHAVEGLALLLISLPRLKG